MALTFRSSSSTKTDIEEKQVMNDQASFSASMKWMPFFGDRLFLFMKNYTVLKKDEGQTLIKYLRRILKSSGDPFIYRMLRKKNITLSGKKASGKEIIMEGDEVKIFLSDETFLKMSGVEEKELFIKTDIKPLIIFEDDDMIISSKPAGILSQKADQSTVSMNDILLSYLEEKNATASGDISFHPSISNRLDRNTSGLIFFAKTYRGQNFLSDVLRDRALKKYYLAVIHGVLEDEGEKSAYLSMDPKEEKNMVSVSDSPSESTREVRTGFRTMSISLDRRFSLVECDLITGAKHQIRAHLSFLGHPVLFDRKYGDMKKDESLSFPGKKRQLLHAYKAVFPDKREFTAPIPDDIKKALSFFKLEI